MKVALVAPPCLMILFFYTALKLQRSIVPCLDSLMILFFYTALKLCTSSGLDVCVWWSFSFTLLSNTHPCQLFWPVVWWSFSFTLLSNPVHRPAPHIWFDDPFLLHCSQTKATVHSVAVLFDDPFLLHCSQTNLALLILLRCLMILFFYTALKHSDIFGHGSSVWWSFSFTLLSNYDAHHFLIGGVWWSFSFTLLSNGGY